MALSQQKAILQVIREWMKDRGLTMQDLAEHIGSSQSSISRALTGETELSLERIYEISGILGVSASVIFEEAERRMAPNQLSEGLEEFLCSELRRYLVFVALNRPKSITELMEEANTSRVGVESVLKRLKGEGLLLAMQGDRFQLSERAFRSKFRNTRVFYELKQKLYALQGEQTFKKLDSPREYWATRDDRLVVGLLNEDQAKQVSSMLEAVAKSVQEMDRHNHRASAPGVETHQIFLAQKKFSDLG